MTDNRNPRLRGDDGEVVHPLPLGLGIAAVVVVLDQAAKLWLLYVFDLLNRGHTKVLPFFDLAPTWNTGISYGLFPQEGELGRWFLFGIKVVAAILLTIWLRRTPSRLTAVALGLIIGGAIGNAIDRLLHGAVFDFALLYLAGSDWRLNWYVFNLADAAIVAGVAVLLYESVSGDVPQKRPDPGRSEG